jgi:predicted metal-dependent hydrolase
MLENERRRLMEEGARAFNSGEFFVAHELWEAVWNAIDEPSRTWVQGMIQLAAGLYKLQQDRPELCRALLQKGIAKLHDAPVALDGFALVRLRDDAGELDRLLGAGQKVAASTVVLHSA